MSASRGMATVSRADSGMPVISADTEPAAFFGLGWAQAEDDLVGLLRQYLLARGELSTVDGPDAADRDRNQHRWQIAEQSRAAYMALPREAQACYDAFIDGVAAYIEANPDAVPAWTPPLEAWMPIAVNQTVMLFWVTADAVATLRAEGIGLPPVVSELDRAPMTPGSNAWVILPSRTNGETLLVSDPHLPFGGALAMHEATVVTSTLHYTGFTFLGAMLPPLAHTADCGWGATTGGPRVSDAYRVPDTDADAVVINGLRSPIVARQGGHAYAVCTPYVGLAAETELQFFDMLRAHDTADLLRAFERRAFPPQNILAADRHGNGFYLRTGRVPRRTPDMTGVLGIDQLWDGFLGPDELVHVIDPPSGTLQNCNSAPDTVAAELSADDWTPDAFNDVPGRQTSRSDRTATLLEAPEPISVEDVTAWAVEDLWPDTEVWRESLAATLAAQPARVAAYAPPRRALLDLLLGFDGHASPDSVAASAWLAWRTAVATTDATAEVLRPLVEGRDGDLLLDALERTETTHLAYGVTHAFASGHPGRGGAFTVRPSARGDVQPSMQVPLRATYFTDGIATAGGPALRIVSYGELGMRSWSLLLPARADVFARGGVLPTAFNPNEATVRHTLNADARRGAGR